MIVQGGGAIYYERGAPLPAPSPDDLPAFKGCGSHALCQDPNLHRGAAEFRGPPVQINGKFSCFTMPVGVGDCDSGVVLGAGGTIKGCSDSELQRRFSATLENGVLFTGRS